MIESSMPQSGRNTTAKCMTTYIFEILLHQQGHNRVNPPCTHPDSARRHPAPPSIADPRFRVCSCMSSRSAIPDVLPARLLALNRCLAAAWHCVAIPIKDRSA